MTESTVLAYHFAGKNGHQHVQNDCFIFQHRYLLFICYLLKVSQMVPKMATKLIPELSTKSYSDRLKTYCDLLSIARMCKMSLL